jgi:4-hydroxy-2-oxoheptanedioate aldolase
MRFNHLISVLERGEVAHAGGFLLPGNPDMALEYGALDYDAVYIDTEHSGFESRELANTLHYLARPGSPYGQPTPLVRLPPSGREHNQFWAKQALDRGVFGLLFPHIETVEEAQAAVVASRYPQMVNTEYPVPAGQRGCGPRITWGLSDQEYYERADLWPLNPDGEILLMMIIESAAGVENIADIAREVKGIGAVWAGSADMALSLGAGPDFGGEAVQAAQQRVLEACQENDIPCCVACVSPEDAEQRREQGYRILFSMPELADPVLAATRKH